MKKAILYISIFTALTLSSCKEKTQVGEPAVPAPTEEVLQPPTDKEKPFDELYTYAKSLYFWNEDITITRKKAREFAHLNGSEYENLDALLERIKKDSKGLDRFSGLVESQNGARVSLTASDPQQSDPIGNTYGKVTGQGLYVCHKTNGYFVSYVDKAGPANVHASMITLKRGDKIEEINWMDADGLSEKEFQEQFSAVKRGEYITVKVRRAGQLIARSFGPPRKYDRDYIEDPRFFEIGSKQVAYMRLSSFPAPYDMKAAFEEMVTEGLIDEHVLENSVHDLIVDLRFNPGGVVEGQDVLASNIIRSGNNGKILSTDLFNTSVTDNKFLPGITDRPFFKSSLFHSTHFINKSGKSGFSEIQNVYFLVSNESASCSELIINNLRPYVKVKVIGEKTYGKAVGFIPLFLKELGRDSTHVTYQYRLYLSTHGSKNADGRPLEFQGINPDYPVEDNLAPIGVPGDSLFDKAVSLIEGR